MAKWLMIDVGPDLHEAVRQAAKEDRRSMTQWAVIHLQKAAQEHKRQHEQAGGRSVSQEQR